MKRVLTLVIAAAALTFVLLALRTADTGPRIGVLSLLVVGDTGQPVGGPLAALRPQYQVARALAAEDARAAIDGVVLLGDNFYPNGIEEDELKDRLRINIVGPYCRFMAFTSRGRGSLEGDCPVARHQRHPVPMYAVLGNHDYGERESPDLQKKVVPQYLENWRMPNRVEVYELPGGVSLIPYQSMPLVEGKGTGRLVEALKSSKGPWRILAAHHPIADPGGGHAEKYSKRIRDAIAEAGVPVHVHLGGHEHNLQAIAGDGSDDAALHVVAGSGSDTRKVGDTPRKRLFGEETLGFARIDRTDADSKTLKVTLFAVPSTPGVGAKPRAEFDVTMGGAIHQNR